MSTDTSPRIKRRKGSKHDRTGCLTCRYRYHPHTHHLTYAGSFHNRHKKDVKNTFPDCGACMRLNLQCIREPKRYIGPVQAHTDTPPPVQPLDLYFSHSPTSTRDPDLSSTRQHAMKYYITVMAQHLTVSNQHNSFLSGPISPPLLSSNHTY